MRTCNINISVGEIVSWWTNYGLYLQINEIRKLIGPATSKVPVPCSDDIISRYLRARNWNTKKATKMLKDTVKWRMEHKPEKIRWVSILCFSSDYIYLSWTHNCPITWGWKKEINCCYGTAYNLLILYWAPFHDLKKGKHCDCSKLPEVVVWVSNGLKRHPLHKIVCIFSCVSRFWRSITH